jgi:Aldehyde dehydrogenase family/Membrane dipeptidase (Peptidase family M19)
MRPIRTCCERSTDSGCGWGAVLLRPETLRCACNTSRCAPPRAYDPDISSLDATADEWTAQADFVIPTVGSDHVGIGLDLAGGRSCTPKNAHRHPDLVAALKGVTTPENVLRILGENWLRLLDVALRPSEQPDLKAAHTVASKVRAGVVWVNGWAAIDPALPWGGMKTSGIGRELGLSGLLADTEEKVVTIIL